MKKLLLSLSLLIGLIGSASAARVGPVEFGSLPTGCAATSGGIINYNSITGAFSCVTVTGDTLTWKATQTFNTIGGFLAHITTQTGTSYTAASTDCGTQILFTNASAVTVTLPNSLPVGCQIAFTQGGAGSVTPTPASGAILNSPHSFVKTFAKNSTISVNEVTNSGGSSAVYNLTGDGQ